MAPHALGRHTHHFLDFFGALIIELEVGDANGGSESGGGGSREAEVAAVPAACSFESIVEWRHEAARLQQPAR